MGLKEEELLSNVTGLIREVVLENKLKYVMNYSELADVDVTTLKAVAINLGTVRAEGKYTEQNEYSIMDITISLGNGVEFDMSLDTEEMFQSVIHLPNYFLEYSSQEGTNVIPRTGVEKKYLWMEEIARDAALYEYLTESNDLFWDAFSEVVNRNLPKLADLKKLLPDVKEIKSMGVTEAYLIFQNGVELDVTMKSLNRTLERYAHLTV